MESPDPWAEPPKRAPVAVARALLPWAWSSVRAQSQTRVSGMENPMKTDSEISAALAASSVRVLDLAQSVELARTREELALSLIDLRGALQEQFLWEAGAGLTEQPGPGVTWHTEILTALSTEIAELRAEIDGVWRERRTTRDAMLRAVRRHQEVIGRSTHG